MGLEIVGRLSPKTSAVSDIPIGTGARVQARNAARASFASMKFNTQALGLAVAVLTSALISACTTIGHERVEGWPVLTMVDHRVPHKEMRDRCGKYVGFTESPEACVEFDFAAKRCDMWFSADFPPAAFVVKHEQLHCLGFEHEGETGLREAWNQYLAATARLASASASQGSSRVEQQ